MSREEARAYAAGWFIGAFMMLLTILTLRVMGAI